MRREMRVIYPGPFTTVQDNGRYGHQSEGFIVSGCADSESMKIANILCGNDPCCGVLEMTLAGMCVQFMCDTVIAVSGADIVPFINGKRAEMNRAYFLPEGSYFMSSGSVNGIRAYLAVSGGFDIPSVMGSVSTGLKFALGGFGGRRLKAGDTVPLNRETPRPANIAERRTPRIPYESSVTLRCVRGPQDGLFTEKGIADFFGGEYTVTNASDRMGIRFDGTPLESVSGTDIISDGICCGSVQVPINGKPILLLADHQTTGGYAKIATVISADIPKAAQLAAGNTVRFEEIGVAEAQEIARERHAYLAHLAAETV